MKNWSLKQRILASFAVILTIMCIMAGLAYSRLAVIEREAEGLRTDSMPGLYYSTASRAAWFEGLQLVQEFLDVDDPAARAYYQSIFANNAQALIRALTQYQTTATTDAETAWLRELKVHRTEFDRVRNEVLEVARSGDAQRARAANRRANSPGHRDRSLGFRLARGQ